MVILGRQLMHRIWLVLTRYILLDLGLDKSYQISKSISTRKPKVHTKENKQRIRKNAFFLHSSSLGNPSKPKRKECNEKHVATPFSNTSVCRCPLTKLTSMLHHCQQGLWICSPFSEKKCLNRWATIDLCSCLLQAQEHPCAQFTYTYLENLNQT